MKEIEIWACKRYSSKYPQLCVEPRKVKFISIADHKKRLETIVKREEAECQKNVHKLQKEIVNLKTKAKIKN